MKKNQDTKTRDAFCQQIYEPIHPRSTHLLHIFSRKALPCVCALYIYKYIQDSRRTVHYYKPGGVIVSKEPSWRRPCLGTSKCWQPSTGRSIDSAASHDHSTSTDSNTPFYAVVPRTFRFPPTVLSACYGIQRWCMNKLADTCTVASVCRCRSRLDKLQFAAGLIVYGKIQNRKLEVTFFPFRARMKIACTRAYGHSIS